MYELIASPTRREHVIFRPGDRRALRIGAGRFAELQTSVQCPPWLVEQAQQTWGLDLTGSSLAETVIVRKPSVFGHVRASYELNLGCNYDCEHCYLGLKQFSGMSWEDREKVLLTMRDAGVLWLQITGGEPLIDPYFAQVYQRAYELGMMLQILTNGSRLHRPAVLDLLTTHRPQLIVISVYGATEDSYDGLTRRRGAFRKFRKGLDAAVEAGLPIELSLIVTHHNAHELDAMKGLADSLGLSFNEYTNMSPTIHGGGETLPTQSAEHLRARRPFTGCNAGRTFFHVDPHGAASICKIGREPHIDLPTEGLPGLQRLGTIADQLLSRQGACSSCSLQSTCGTCPPLVDLYRRAQAPLATFCQHGNPRKEIPV